MPMLWEGLLIAHLLQPHHGAAQELPHRRGADAQRQPDFGVAQPFQTQKQASPLLLRKAIHRVVKPCHTLMIDQFAFGSVLVSGEPLSRKPPADLRVVRLLGILPGPDFKPQIVRHPENPGAWVLNLFSFTQSGIQPKEDFLRRLLSPWGMKPEREQVAIDVIARLLEQPAYPILQSCVLQGCAGPFLPGYVHEPDYVHELYAARK